MKPDFESKQLTRLLPETVKAIDCHRKAVKRDTGKTPSINATINEMILFTAGYEKSVSKPIDYAAAPLDLLRDYAVHGYDFTIRAPALAEIERRYNAKFEGVE